MTGGWTKGECSVSGVRYKMNGGEWQNVSCYDAAAKREVNVAAVSIDPQTLEGLADAHLFADALNVANETGLTPRQLADQNKELFEIVQMMAGFDGRNNTTAIRDLARAVIAKCTGAV